MQNLYELAGWRKLDVRSNVPILWRQKAFAGVFGRVIASGSLVAPKNELAIQAHCS